MKTAALGLLAAVVALLAPSARAGEPPIIAKARACVASEEAFARMKTVHFIGRLVRPNPDFPNDPSKAASTLVEIYFEKPWRERIVARAPGRYVETALDGFDGWQRTVDEAAGAKPSLVLLGADVTENLRADTWENLNFYRGLDQAGGRTEDQGPVSVNGIACEKVAFIHSPTIAYARYFDRATGRLVLTETAAGVVIVERGEIIEAGIRFPQSLTTRQRDNAGVEHVSNYVFDKIIVNEALPDSYFTVPLPSSAP